MLTPDSFSPRSVVSVNDAIDFGKPFLLEVDRERRKSFPEISAVEKTLASIERYHKVLAIEERMRDVNSVIQDIKKSRLVIDSLSFRPEKMVISDDLKYGRGFKRKKRGKKTRIIPRIREPKYDDMPVIFYGPDGECFTHFPTGPKFSEEKKWIRPNFGNKRTTLTATEVNNIANRPKTSAGMSRKSKKILKKAGPRRQHYSMLSRPMQLSRRRSPRKSPKRDIGLGGDRIKINKNLTPLKLPGNIKYKSQTRKRYEKSPRRKKKKGSGRRERYRKKIEKFHLSKEKLVNDSSVFVVKNTGRNVTVLVKSKDYIKGRSLGKRRV